MGLRYLTWRRGRRGGGAVVVKPLQQLYKMTKKSAVGIFKA